MRGKKLVAVACVSLTSLVCVGCGSDTSGMQAYNPPALRNEQAAVVKGSQGVYVVSIDNQKVDSGVRSAMGGNEVLVTPGKHRVHVERASGVFPTGLSYTLSTKATFEHTFVAGHTYDVDSVTGFRMEDEVTHEKVEPLP